MVETSPAGRNSETVGHTVQSLSSVSLWLSMAVCTYFDLMAGWCHGTAAARTNLAMCSCILCSERFEGVLENAMHSRLHPSAELLARSA